MFSLSCSFVIFSKSFCNEFGEAFVLDVLLPSISPVVSAAFWINFFEVVCSRFFSMIKTFWFYLPLKFLLIFLPIFSPIFRKRHKHITFYKYLTSRFN